MPMTTRRSSRVGCSGGLRGARGAHGDAAGGMRPGEDGGDGLGAGEAEREIVRIAASAVGMAFDMSLASACWAIQSRKRAMSASVPAIGAVAFGANISVAGSKQGGGGAGSRHGGIWLAAAEAETVRE